MPIFPSTLAKTKDTLIYIFAFDSKYGTRNELQILEKRISRKKNYN